MLRVVARVVINQMSVIKFKEMKKGKFKISDEVLLLNYRINMESPYNDGWTQDSYRHAYNKLLKKMKKKKKLADKNQ